MNRDRRTIKNRNKFIKITAIVLCVAGFSILVSQFYGDLYTMYKQRLLRQKWDSQSTRANKKPIAKTDTPKSDSRDSSERNNQDRQADQHPTDNKPKRTVNDETSAAESTTKSQNSNTGEKPLGDTPIPTIHTRIKLGSAFARIVIPKIKVDEIVVEGVDQERLALGPGHMEETAWPGEYSNMVISGHRVTHSRPFFNLDRLKIGDPIIIYTKSQQFTYNVIEKKVVKPTDLSVIKPTKNRILTLTTCNPPYSARTRLIIHAKMY